MRMKLAVAELCIVLFAIQLSCALPVAVGTQASDGTSDLKSRVDWKGRFLAEAPQEWAKFEKAVGGFEGSITYERHYVDPQKKEDSTRRGRTEYYLNASLGGALISLESQPLGRTTFKGFNGGYDFRLVKDNPNVGVHLVEYTPHDSKPKAFMERIAGQGVDALFAAETHDMGVRLKDLIAAPYFKITSGRLVEEQGGTLVRLEVERTTGDKAYPGWILVDPARHWAIVRYQQQYPGMTSEGRVKYNDAISEVAFPESRFHKDSFTDGVTDTFKYQYSPPRACKLGLSSFQLPAFGLKEPQGKR